MKTIFILFCSIISCLGQAFTWHDLALVESQNTGTNVFQPSDIAGLKFWFKSESLTGLAAEGGSVSNWPDSSGNNWYLTNTTLTKCPYLTNSFNGLTGTNALSFDGSDDVLWVSNALAMAVANNISDSTMIVVARVLANTGTKATFFIAKNAANSAREYIYSDSLEKWGAGGRNADANSFVGIVCPTVAATYAYSVEADFMHSTGDLFLYTNNVVANSTTSWQADANTSATDSTHIDLGMAGNGEPFLGTIAEVLYYVPSLSAANRTNVWNYLNSKYNLRP